MATAVEMGALHWLIAWLLESNFTILNEVRLQVGSGDRQGCKPIEHAGAHIDRLPQPAAALLALPPPILPCPVATCSALKIFDLCHLPAPVPVKHGGLQGAREHASAGAGEGAWVKCQQQWGWRAGTLQLTLLTTPFLPAIAGEHRCKQCLLSASSCCT